MTWSTGSTGGGWGAPEPDETRPAPTTASAWTAGGAGDGWGGTGTPATGDPVDSWASSAGSGGTAVMTQSGPPLRWLGLAALVPLLAALLFVTTGPVVNAVGWAVAAFGGVALLGVFQARDLARRASDWYAAQDSLVSGLRVVVLLLALGIATGHAVFLAFWIARLDIFA